MVNIKVNIINIVKRRNIVVKVNQVDLHAVGAEVEAEDDIVERAVNEVVAEVEVVVEADHVLIVVQVGVIVAVEVTAQDQGQDLVLQVAVIAVEVVQVVAEAEVVVTAQDQDPALARIRNAMKWNEMKNGNGKDYIFYIQWNGMEWNIVACC